MRRVQLGLHHTIVSVLILRGHRDGPREMMLGAYKDVCEYSGYRAQFLAVDGVYTMMSTLVKHCVKKGAQLAYTY